MCIFVSEGDNITSKRDAGGCIRMEGPCNTLGSSIPTHGSRSLAHLSAFIQPERASRPGGLIGEKMDISVSKGHNNTSKRDAGGCIRMEGPCTMLGSSIPTHGSRSLVHLSGFIQPERASRLGGLIDQEWAFSYLRGTITRRNETQEVVSGWKGLALCLDHRFQHMGAEVWSI